MAATSAARNRANEVPARLPISDYDRLSVKEIVPLLAPLSDTELQLVVAHEKATKNRVTLLRSMKRIELSSPPGTPRPAPRKTPAPEARSKRARQPSKKPAPQPGLEAIADSVNGNGSAAPSAHAAPSVQAEPSVQYEPTPAPEAPPTRAGRGRRSVRKLRKEKAAAKATETDNNGSRQRHPSTGLRSVEPDLEEREAAAAPRPRPPAVHSRWEEEVPPVELTWELEDDDAPSVEDLVISPEVRERLNAPEVQARPKTEVKAGPKTEVAEPELAQPEVPQPEPQHPLDEWDDEDEDEGEGDQAPEPWGIDDFPDVAGESEHGASEEPALRSVPTPI
ncbi:MAG: hypothetical protein QOJ69_1025, partial [Actinomycetota bacterium]|nr:hypothetical protein [Actinomycetota bacterium]